MGQTKILQYDLKVLASKVIQFTYIKQRRIRILHEMEVGLVVGAAVRHRSRAGVTIMFFH
jgi:hypothetical protein